ncbi:unnamed protein product [Peronospora belbahrii]|nr:unnamed protein product [Peronospora belbahrii]
MALSAAVMSCWAAAATAQARAALIAFLVFVAKKTISSTSPQLVVQHGDEDDVFDEFNAVFETAARPTKTIRELQHRAKLMAEGLEKDIQLDGAQQSEAPKNGEANLGDDNEASGTIQPPDLEDEYEMLPELEEDRAFYDNIDEQQAKNQDSKTEGERLLQLASSISDTSMHVEEFIVSGTHNNFESITKDVDELAAETSESEKRSVVRVLLAYCAYSKDTNYSSEMVLTAGECLRVWQGDEDRAFKSLAVLCNDVPRLCGALD